MSHEPKLSAETLKDATVRIYSPRGNMGGEATMSTEHT